MATSREDAVDAGAGLAARLYIPSDVLGGAFAVYFHGGAFAVHSSFSGARSRFLSALVAAARVVAVSGDYRLAPSSILWLCRRRSGRGSAAGVLW